jgi:hypothetical protein
MIWNKTLIRGTSSAAHDVCPLSRENDFDVEDRMTAGIATEDGRRVAPAITALAVAMGASGIWIARPRTDRVEAGP